jgi:hypothetical protein
MDESTPIDAVLTEVRECITQARELLSRQTHAGRSQQLLEQLADGSEQLADYVGQPAMEKAALRPGGLSASAAAEAEHARRHMGRVPIGPATELLEDESGPVPGDFCMSDVVDEIARTAPDVVAYVEQTGGGCATIYAARREPGADPVLYQAPGEDFGRWPVMAGPGSFDWSGRNHTAHTDDFYVGPDTELMAPVPGPPYGPYPGEYTATRADTPATLAGRVVAAARGFCPAGVGVAEGVIVWPGR